MKQTKKVIIIGSGLSGLSLATELVDEGFAVTVLEKNSYLGGRASNTLDSKTGDPVPIGPHIFLYCYNNFLGFLKKIGAQAAISWERKLFLDFVYNGEHHQAYRSKLPAPFYFLPMFYHYKFLSIPDKMTNAWLSLKIFFTSEKKLEKLDEINAYDFLVQEGVNQNSINKIWRFFVLSMLNVPLELCSATELCLLVRFWAKLNHSQIGFAKVGLGDVYVKNAKEYLRERGSKIVSHTTVKEIIFKDEKIDHIVVEKNGISKKVKADIYVSTLTPIDLRALLPEDKLFSDFFRPLNAFEPSPYISVNLWFDRKITDQKFWALLNDEETPKYMNTDFYDQSNIYSTRKKQSYITSNIIYSRAYDKMSDAQIIKKTLAELLETFPYMDAKLIHSQIHRIPYVIYAPFPGVRQHKLPHKTPYENFYITGDWTIKEIPQCMEAAVRSGYKCAEVILADNGVKKKICNDEVG